MKSFCRFASHAALLACIAALALWGLSRLTTDRWQWSQYLFWAPSPMVLSGAAAMLALAAIGAWAGRPATPNRRRWPHRLRLAAVGMLALAVAYMLVIEWRVPNALRSGTTGAPPLRVVNWNITAVELAEQITGPVGAQHADLAILVNPHSRVDWRQVYASFDELPHRLLHAEIVVLSRYPIVRMGSCDLGLPEPTDELGHPAPHARFDPGRAMYFELDATPVLGRSIIVWVIDMPSDERLSRWELARAAGGAIASWTGAESRPDERGIMRRASAGPGFPAPDLIVGDFNIPRGSASLAFLTQGTRSAFDQAGWGWSVSWPRVRPLVHIDQAFVSAALRAIRYKIVDPTFGYHRMQVVDLAPGP